MTKCSNSCDAKALVTVNGGIGPYTYKWDDAANSTTQQVDLCKGTYTVTVTDAIGCSTTATVDVTSPDPIVIDDVTFTENLACNGDKTDLTVTAHGGTGNLTYSIDGGKSFINVGQTFKNLTAGDYTIMIRDVNDCPKDTTIKITQPDALDIESLTSKPVSCNGTSTGEVQAVVKGGTAPYTYELSDGTTNNTGIFTGLPAGTYHITITDKNGCGNIVSDDVVLTDPAVLSFASVESSNIKCFGEDNGSIIIHGAGGTRPYLFSIDGTEPTLPDSIFNNLKPGTYTPAIKDANGCSATYSPVTLTEPVEIVIKNISKTDITSCYGEKEGAISIDATGGTGALEYSINGGDEFVLTSAFTGLPGGTYNVVVKDATGCSKSQTVTIDQPAPIIITKLTYTNVSGTSKGTIHVEATGGMGVLMYSIGGAFQPTGDFENLDPGSYTVYVRDEKPCTIDSTIYISDLIVDVTKTDAKCFGESNGSIILTVTSGGKNILYSIDDGKNTQTTGEFKGLPAGIYYIKVWDETGATFKQTVSIGSGTEIKASLIISDVETCAGESTGALLVIASGSGTLTYSLDDGTNVKTQPEELFNNLKAGSYTVLVTDGTGCSVARNAEIKEPALIMITVQTTDVVGSTKGTAHVVAAGGTGALHYSLDGSPYQDSPDFFDLAVNTYTVSVKDDNGCVQTATFKIERGNSPINYIISDACNGNNGAIAVHCKEGCDGALYSIDGGTPQDSPLFGNLKPGNHTITIDYTDRPDYTEDIYIGTPSLTAVITKASCAQLTADGAIETTLHDADPKTTSFLWSTAQTNDSIYNLTSGNYIVQYVTTGSYVDGSTCALADTFRVGSIDTIYVYAGKDTSVCPGKGIVLTANEDLAALPEIANYIWYQGDTTEVAKTQKLDVTPKVTSMYTVYMSYKTCTTKDTINVVVHPVLGLYAGRDTAVSEGYSVQLEATSSTGEDFASYLWRPSDYLDNDAIKNPVLTPVEAKQVTMIYGLIATTKEGCVETDTVLVTIAGSVHPYSGFTPNGDGANDVWIIDNAEYSPNIKVTVFNRWGEKVFYSKGYDNVTTKFDGTRNGKPLPEGTYYFVIETEDGSSRISGPITLMR
ncbi:MAG TPA: gliding motility-associated C-terminal domain-containing protein [Bacteroidales bacterium]|nr:gliding motility-associated C-terminal domain-containing protein [Bacteroidales bacterium]